MSDNYLTMARIMNKERTEWIEKRGSKWYHGLTAIEQINIKEAFNAGFMKGFEGKYFSSEN